MQTGSAELANEEICFSLRSHPETTDLCEQLRTEEHITLRGGTHGDAGEETEGRGGGTKHIRPCPMHKHTLY